MDTHLLLVIIVLIGLALAFDFMNGFHDAANSIATIVSTQVLSPQMAVAWAAFFNFVAFLFFDHHVAATIGKGTVHKEVVDNAVIFGALAGALSWNIITWWFGIPSSSSHALVGGLAGAAVAKTGSLSALIGGGFLKTAGAIVLSPMLGMLLAITLSIIVTWFCVRSTPVSVDMRFRKLQFVSAALYSLGHGGNDAQKTMGIIMLLLISNNMLPGNADIPLWVILSCQIAMGLGTLFGGWRIVKTMGMGITKLKPMGGFCAETAGAITLFLATSLGIPVSTTHTITGAIVGVGASRRMSAVRWGLAGRIVWAWVLTIPCSALVSAICWKIGTMIF
ncbi:inorganic phosphate transporter [Leeia sp. TBRC 13508]|uniref:Inorganic phosphate transporter n=1 Tax=Leeia speluncae TaxID=2884804 RepID=A0ABS8D7G6_9NEIS|nr:inorganic phosphate transporter [Leeia speluncae]MCB6184140.1 inorganic phosphate transporter [Leeia speluncae]